jgi:anti-sigma28 factor (negative regulator of flagellin synthesis)
MIDPTRSGDPTNKSLASLTPIDEHRRVPATGAAGTDASPRDGDTLDVELAADIVETTHVEAKRLDLERLATLKATVANGSYKVDAGALADRIMNDTSV